METAPLKSFATWARTALIREVTARIAAVLAPGSSERVEQAKAVAALEKAVTAAGGGDKGRAAVADKVAYTWFNRIIALRFMDANGYTGIGVVSPQPGIEVGQPEVLAEAKRGVVDSDVVNQTTRTAVDGLLNGTRTSGDPQGEAYALLLADYCRHWNRAMPFMFEREGDFTELLIPASLLADDSVLNRAVKVLTSDVCQDVEVIGWLYQFYLSERKDEVFAGFKKHKKAGADEIPAATQLFTPHWIVRYLVENSLGRLWMLNRPSSGLVEQMDYYIAPVEDGTEFLKIAKPEELKVIDPACGSGHMLTYAFDLLYRIYDEEGYAPSEIPGLILVNNLYGTEIDPRAGALAAFALTMKARAKQRTFFNKQVEPNICAIEPISFGTDELDFLVTRGGDRHKEIAFWNQFEHAETFGALIHSDPGVTARLAQHLETLDDGGDLLKADVIEWANLVVDQANCLTPRYAVVVANPPYMGQLNMDAALSEWVKSSYPTAKQDLYACFIERCLELTVTDGIMAIITGDTWLSMKAFRDLRIKLIQDVRVESLIHLQDAANHADAFGANTAFVVQHGAPAGDRTSRFFRLTEASDDAKARRLRRGIDDPKSDGVYDVRVSDFESIPEFPFGYRVSPTALAAFRDNPRLTSVRVPRIGIQSGNNELHYRYWWEVSTSRIRRNVESWDDLTELRPVWVPLQRGGDRRRWYGNVDSVVNLADAGRAILQTRNGSLRNSGEYFRPSISWNRLSNGRFYPRWVDAGTAFDDMSPFIAGGPSARIAPVLGVLASAAARHLLSITNQGRKTEVGHVAALPWPGERLDGELMEERVSQLVELSREDWNRAETSMDYAGIVDPDLAAYADVEGWVEATEARLDQLVDTVRSLEVDNDRLVARAYRLDGEVPSGSGVGEVTLQANPAYRYGVALSDAEGRQRRRVDIVRDLVSFAVGCMFGRYSLDDPRFAPDADNVIPMVDDDWFEDDIATVFRRFIAAVFGERGLEANARFVEDALGVNNLRDYFVTMSGKSKFYDDHVQRYKKRPIYWLFSSPKGSFNALIYMHRYTTSTVSTVLNEYLREFQVKLKASLEHAERSNNAKEADRLRKVLLELDEYEHDVLYPLASQNIAIDLDDGVKANYPKLGAALKTIPGLEASE